MFEDVVGLPLDPLLADTLALPKAELDEIVFDQGKLLCWHRLNARGLRVLRAMLARRASEFNRISKGWEIHPQYSFFMHHGFVKKRLDNWKPGDTKDFPLSAAEMDLYRMVTGHDTPWSPVAHDLWVSSTVHGLVTRSRRAMRPFGFSTSLSNKGTSTIGGTFSTRHTRTISPQSSSPAFSATWIFSLFCITSR